MISKYRKDWLSSCKAQIKLQILANKNCVLVKNTHKINEEQLDEQQSKCSENLAYAGT